MDQRFEEQRDTSVTGLGRVAFIGTSPAFSLFATVPDSLLRK